MITLSKKIQCSIHETEEDLQAWYVAISSVCSELMLSTLGGGDESGVSSSSYDDKHPLLRELWAIKGNVVPVGVID